MFSHFAAFDVSVGILQYSLQLHSVQCLLTGILLQQEVQIVISCFLWFIQIAIYSKIVSDQGRALSSLSSLGTKAWSLSSWQALHKIDHVAKEEILVGFFSPLLVVVGFFILGGIGCLGWLVVGFFFSFQKLHITKAVGNSGKVQAILLLNCRLLGKWGQH